MIVVKVYVHPGGDASRARTLHTLEIERVSTDWVQYEGRKCEWGNYVVSFVDEKGVSRRAKHGVGHMVSDGALALVDLALAAIERTR